MPPVNDTDRFSVTAGHRGSRPGMRPFRPDWWARGSQRESYKDGLRRGRWDGPRADFIRTRVFQTRTVEFSAVTRHRQRGTRSIRTCPRLGSPPAPDRSRGERASHAQGRNPATKASEKFPAPEMMVRFPPSTSTTRMNRRMMKISSSLEHRTPRGDLCFHIDTLTSIHATVMR